MTYMRFTPIARNIWEVSTPVKSSDPLATIWKKRGQYSAVFSEDHAVSAQELRSVAEFMRERQAA